METFDSFGGGGSPSSGGIIQTGGELIFDSFSVQIPTSPLSPDSLVASKEDCRISSLDLRAVGILGRFSVVPHSWDLGEQDDGTSHRSNVS
jgi:hypothetical protein